MIRLNVNGKDKVVDGIEESTTPLLWVLRDLLGLIGTKFGCGMAQCGACTVHLNGVPMRSCQTPVGDRGRPEDHDHRGLASADGSRIRCRKRGSSTTFRSAATARPAS